MRRFITRITPLAAMLALLSGCILVDDFGARWEQAKPDACLREISKTLYLDQFRRDLGDKNIDDVARELTLDGQNYILMKKDPADKGGRIFRFTISKGKELHAIHVVYTRWRLDPSMRETFLQSHPHSAAQVDDDTVTIPNLEGDSEKLLAEIANKPDYWQVEDQTLYNILHDPKCRFETRDFSEEEQKFHNAKHYHLNKPTYHGAPEPMTVPEGVRAQ